MHNYSTTKKQSNESSFKTEELSGSLNTASIRVAIVGASGYSGMELGRCLLKHPFVHSITLIVNETAIETNSWIPEARNHREKIQIKKLTELKNSTTDTHGANDPKHTNGTNEFDLIFLATPAEVSMELTPHLLQSSLKVIDLSGAFRLSQADSYETWYNFKHTSPNLLNSAHYGLVPFNTIRNPNEISLIANPGCYATSVLMALIPLVKNSLIQIESLVIDSKSGTTGAGKKPTEMQLFAEVDEDCFAYRIGKHQHFPEICQYLSEFSLFSNQNNQSNQSKTHSKLDPIFSTTLLPLRRGIVSSIYGRLKNGITSQDIAKAYETAYENYPLVRIASIQQTESKSLLSLRTVVGSARTHITYSVDGTKLQIYSTIDNLLKGAASQAIENMNYLFKWPINTGLNNFEGLI